MSEFDLEGLIAGANAHDVFNRVAELLKSGEIETEDEAVAEVIRRILKLGLPQESIDTIQSLVPRVAAAMMGEPKLAHRLRHLLNEEVE